MELSGKTVLLLAGGVIAVLAVGVRSFAAPAGNEEKPAREEVDGAIAFVGEVVEAAKSPHGREFLKLAAEPGNPGLRECYPLVRAVKIGAKPDWKVSRRKDDGWFNVTFRPEDGGRMMVVLQQDAGQWKFVYAAR